MFAIGITNDIDVNQIIGMTSEPKELDEQYWLTTAFTDLDNIVTEVIDSLCASEPGTHYSVL